MTPEDEQFVAPIADRLLSLPGVVGVALGGSRARGNERADSDWDLALYVRDAFRTDDVRALAADAGWTGHVAERGEWGPVMNGGAWLQIPGPDGAPRKVDLMWRELPTLDVLGAEADRGEFRVVRIPFAVAGLPSYVPVAELSFGHALRGHVPAARAMPAALRTNATAWWTQNAEFDLDYATMLAGRGEIGLTVGLLARVLVELAHARQCNGGAWVLNEKGLLAAAGLDDVGDRLAATGSSTDDLLDICGTVRTRLGSITS